eukprot:511221-Rhodomonas_salina.2
MAARYATQLVPSALMRTQRVSRIVQLRRSIRLSDWGWKAVDMRAVQLGHFLGVEGLAIARRAAARNEDGFLAQVVGDYHEVILFPWGVGLRELPQEIHPNRVPGVLRHWERVRDSGGAMGACFRGLALRAAGGVCQGVGEHVGPVKQPGNRVVRAIDAEVSCVGSIVMVGEDFRAQVALRDADAEFASVEVVDQAVV